MLTWSYGGGTQSVAIACLIKQERLPKPEIVVMADTGREASETWEYTEQYVKPLFASMGMKLEIAGHDLATVDLYGKNGDLLLPVFTQAGKMPTLCSNEWKKRVVRRFLRARGVTDCVTWLGISLDEIGRLKPSDVQWQRYHWPLCFDVQMTRADCRKLVIDTDLPPPPRSACSICPHRSDAEWLHLKRNYPQDFAQAVTLDSEVRQQDETHNVYLHRSGKPLSEVEFKETEEKPDGLFGPIDGCDSGFCMN